MAAALKKGELAATKKLIVGLLNTLPYPVATPDVITLMENAAHIIEKPSISFDSFGTTGDDILESILYGVLAQNEFQPNENYQLLQLLATLKNIQPVKDLNLLLLMKPTSYPKDVIEARNLLVQALDDGRIEGKAAPGWASPPEKLLSLLTALTASPNDNPYAAYAHVLFPFFRMRYLTMMGYEFVPHSLADIAFLINSFLTVRHPILLREIYFEFTKMPWQTYIEDLDYGKYSDPRTLFLDIIRAILRHPEGLKVCNTITFHYFLNGDTNECPDWLKQTFPTGSTDLRPIEVHPPQLEKPSPPPILSPCPGEDINLIDPECLIEIMASPSHAQFIIDILRYNPARADKYPYNTREAAFQAILDDLKNDKYKDDVHDFVITQAVHRLPLNEKKTWPLEFITLCPSDLQAIHDQEPPETTARPTVVAATDDPEVDKSTQFKTGDLVFSSEETTTEVPASGLDDLLCDEEASQESKCRKVRVINQQSLVDIISTPKITAIKNIIYLMPVFHNDYQQTTREQVLKKVLMDRKDMLNDEVMDYVIPQIISKMSISSDGSLPPIVEEKCEDEQYVTPTQELTEDNDNEGDTQPNTSECTGEKTINPYSLIDVLPASHHTKFLEKLILKAPIRASDYANYDTREGVVKAVLIDRSEDTGEWHVTFDVRKAVAKIHFNQKGQLPVVYLEECPSEGSTEPPTTQSPYLNISPDDVFKGTIAGLGEKPVPCSTEPTPSEAPSDIDTTDSGESTEESTTEEENTAAPSPMEQPDEEEDCTDEEQASSTGAGMAEIGKQPNEKPGETLGDQLLGSILDIVKLPSSGTKKRCKSKSNLQIESPADNCQSGEVLTAVIKIDSLWDALTIDSPRAPYIRSKVNGFMVPIDKSREYTKAEVLRDILLNVRGDVRDPRVLQNVDQLIKCIRFEGPGIQPPLVENICLPSTALSDRTTERPEPPTCKGGEALVTVVQTDSLYIALAPAAPKTPYIRNKVNSYLVPVDSSKIYTKADVLRDILLSLKDDTVDERIVHNIDILLGHIRNDGPALEEPETVDVCLPESSLEETTTTQPSEIQTHQPAASEVPEITFESTDTPTGASLASDNGEPSTASPDTQTGASSASDNGEPIVETPDSPTSPSSTSDNGQPSVESPDTATGASSASDVNTDVKTPESPQNPEQLPELEAEAPTYEPAHQELTEETGTNSPEGGESQCPCPEDRVLFQIIDNQHITNLLSVTDTHFRDRLAQLIMPESKYTNKSRREVLEAALALIMLEDHEIHAVTIRCTDPGTDAPKIITKCVPKTYAELYPMDVVSCPSTESPKPICHHPIDILVPDVLLTAIESSAFQKATDIINIIMNSSLERKKYEQHKTRAEIMKQLLTEMKDIAAEKLRALENEGNLNWGKVKEWLNQLEILFNSIINEGQGNLAPKYINTCVERAVECTSPLCTTTPEPEEHMELKNALWSAAQNTDSSTPPTGRRKIKKTRIIYTTKETINVNIQATKPSTESKPSEDIAQISEIMDKERRNPEERIADEVGRAVDITDKITNQ